MRSSQFSVFNGLVSFFQPSGNQGQPGTVRLISANGSLIYRQIPELRNSGTYVVNPLVEKIASGFYVLEVWVDITGLKES